MQQCCLGNKAHPTSVCTSILASDKEKGTLEQEESWDSQKERMCLHKPSSSTSPGCVTEQRSQQKEIPEAESGTTGEDTGLRECSRQVITWNVKWAPAATTTPRDLALALQLGHRLTAL